MESKKPLDSNLKCCLILAVAAFIFTFVAFATPFWIESFDEFNSQFQKLGLWEACFNNYVHPEDYVSKRYSGCWYIYWPEYDYIRSWLNPPWFYAVQMLSSLSLICNGVTFIVIMLKAVDALDIKHKASNVLALLFQVIAGCCHIVVIVSMGVMSKDREWLPRPDQNHVSWSFAFEVLAGFFTIFCLFQLTMHWFIYNVAPKYLEKETVDGGGNVKIPLLDKGGSSVMYPGGAGMGGTSTIYSQAPKPASQLGTTSGATASAKVREALTQRANQNAGSMNSLNNPYLRNKAGSTHSLASINRNEPPSNLNGSRDMRGSMSSLHSTNRRPRTPTNNDDTIV